MQNTLLNEIIPNQMATSPQDNFIFCCCTQNHLAMNNAFSNKKINTRDTFTPQTEAIWLSISEA